MDNYIIGWIGIIGLIFGFVMLVKYVNKDDKKEHAKSQDNKKQDTEEQAEPLTGENVTYPYKLTQRVFSPKEGYFYRDVRPIADKLGLIVFTKMRLADLLYIPKGTENEKAWFNRIKAKHIDFIFVDSNYKVRLLVEIDDQTHNRADRQARDEEVDEIFRQQGLEVLHLRAWGKQYGAEDLETIITNALNIQKTATGIEQL